MLQVVCSCALILDVDIAVCAACTWPAVDGDRHKVLVSAGEAPLEDAQLAASGEGPAGVFQTKHIVGTAMTGQNRHS